MKKLYFLLSFCFFMFVVSSLIAQQYQTEPVVFNPKTELSTVFGGDMVINNLPFQNQKNISICSAQNGWLYAAYSRDSIIQSKIVIMRSKDHGYIWQQLGNIIMVGSNEQIKKLDIIVTGNNPLEHKLILVDAIHEANPWSNTDVIELSRHNCDPFVSDTLFFGIETSNLHDIDLASAIEYPALSSNPNTIGVIYSTTGTRDSIIFLSSGDGGNTFSNRKIVAVTTKKFHKVALSYGMSLSQNTGRYFAVWEEQQDVGSSLGHIYTAHTEPNYNSSFTTPVKLDGLDPSLTNLCRNPSISCQTNNTDNDSANLTEVVLFEKYNTSSGQHDITGFFNKKATASNRFTRLNIAATQNNEIQPEIMFNSYDSTFNVTYFDSTSLMLPFLSKTFNMVDPDNWYLVSPGYNDDPDLRATNPKVCVNQVTHQAITVWTKLSSAGNGISMFDATYFPPVGMLDNKLPDVPQMLRIFPNPCKNSVSVEFEIGKTEIVTIALYNMLGQSMAIMINQEYRCGQHKLVLDVSQIPVGIYFVTFSTKDFSNSRKLFILR